MGAVKQFEVLEQELAVALREGRDAEAARHASRLNRGALAAQLFERAGEWLEAARAYRDAGQLGRARDVVTKVAAEHPEYPAAARFAIDIAAARQGMNHDLEQFVAPFLRRAPASSEDIKALYVLGQLYEGNNYLPHAIAIYRRIIEVDPGHAAVERLRYAEVSASNNATTEVMVTGGDLAAVRRLFRQQQAQQQQTPSIMPGDRAIGSGSILCERYLLERLLGTGSSGSVFRARDLKLDEYVALKVVDTFASGSTAEARFRREVSLARKLAHPNVVRIYDLAEHDGRNFLTMELLEGTELREFVNQRRLLPPARRELLLQACAGLGYAHNSRVVHRDVKFENLFVTNDAELKVTDFGMAKAPGDVSVTMTGSMGGTPYYMSPEQITDFRSVDQRTDIYALGVVAYELFTHQLPFEAKALTDLLLMHLEKTPDHPCSVNPGVPEELGDLILKAMSKKREDRFQSCDEFALALRAVKL
jgi:tetratricopeptide (TPR) repeat protein